MKTTKTTRTETGHRESAGDAGIVVHFNIRGSILCLTRGARQASTVRSEVNCIKCAAIIARVRA